MSVALTQQRLCWNEKYLSLENCDPLLLLVLDIIREI